MTTLIRPVRNREHAPAQALPAGTLLPISRLGADGTIVLEDGSFVRVIACYPRNLQTLTEDEREATFRSFRGVAAVQERGQSLQLIVEGDRVRTATHMAFVDEQVEKVYGFRPSAVSASAARELDDVQRARWGLYQMALESVRRGATDADFTPRQRMYMVARYRPEDDHERSWRDALPAGLPGSRMSRRSSAYRAPRASAARRLRDHHQLVQIADTRVHELIGHLARDGLTGRILDGAGVLRYVGSRLNPTSVSWDRVETLQAEATVLSRFDDATEREEAERAALAVRELVARSPLDFRRYSDHAEIEPHPHTAFTCIDWILGGHAYAPAQANRAAEAPAREMGRVGYGLVRRSRRAVPHPEPLATRAPAIGGSRPRPSVTELQHG